MTVEDLNNERKKLLRAMLGDLADGMLMGLPYPVLGATLMHLGITFCQVGGMSEPEIVTILGRLLEDQQPFTDTELEAILHPEGERAPDTDRAPEMQHAAPAER